MIESLPEEVAALQQSSYQIAIIKRGEDVDRFRPCWDLVSML